MIGFNANLDSIVLLSYKPDWKLLYSLRMCYSVLLERFSHFIHLEQFSYSVLLERFSHFFHLKQFSYSVLLERFSHFFHLERFSYFVYL